MTSVTTKRFTIDEYHRLIDLGVFNETDRLELIKGQLMEMSLKGTAHSVSCSVLYREVSNSTLVFDRTTKLSLYAEANISNYWIVNLIDLQNFTVHYSHPNPLL
jgi:Uma2 family endonuclease